MALKKFILSSSVLVGILLCGLVYADRIEVYQDEKASDAAALNDDFETIVVLGNINDTYSEITEDAEKLVKMPGSFGDPLGAITAIPGVVSAGDGGEPVVRGSSPEDNRYYVDNMPAGYIFHEFNTSIFDRNVVQDFQLYTSGFGTEFSQATGAVFDIRLRDPNREELSAVLDFSLLRSGLFLESGIGENAGAYISLRKGMLEYFVSEEDEPNEDGVRVISAPSDSDYLVKGVWDIGKNNVVSAVFSGASDSVQAEFAGNNDITEKNPDFAGDAKVDLNFDNQGINWIHQTKNKKFQLTMANYLDEEFTSWGNNYFVKLEQNSKIVRAQLDYKISQNHSLSFGTEYSQNSFDYANRMILFVCSEFDSDCQDSRRDLIELDDKIEINESSVYLNDHWQATPKLSFIFGAQYAGNDFTDEYFINPRVTGSLQINSFLTFTASGGRYNGTPEAENLIPQVGNPDLKSPTADHYSLGVKGSINYLWSWSCETYYK